MVEEKPVKLVDLIPGIGVFTYFARQDEKPTTNQNWVGYFRTEDVPSAIFLWYQLLASSAAYVVLEDAYKHFMN